MRAAHALLLLLALGCERSGPPILESEPTKKFLDVPSDQIHIRRVEPGDWDDIADVAEMEVYEVVVGAPIKVRVEYLQPRSWRSEGLKPAVALDRSSATPDLLLKPEHRYKLYATREVHPELEECLSADEDAASLYSCNDVRIGVKGADEVIDGRRMYGARATSGGRFVERRLEGFSRTYSRNLRDGDEFAALPLAPASVALFMSVTLPRELGEEVRFDGGEALTFSVDGRKYDAKDWDPPAWMVRAVFTAE